MSRLSNNYNIVFLSKRAFTIVLTLSILFICNLSFAANPQTFINSAGIYGLIPVNADPSDLRVNLFLEHPESAGISIRTNWTTIEPTEDAYDWSYIDAMLERAVAVNRHAIIRIGTGPNTPDWVYAAGAEEFIYNEPNLDLEQARMSVPWDPIYLEKWLDFIHEFGGRYNSHPNLAAVIVTGASRSTEMQLPRTQEDQTQWEIQGYSQENITGAWITVIDNFTTAFSNKPLLLSVSPVLIEDGTVESVVNYSIENYPWHLAIKIAYWDEENNPEFFPTAAMLKAVDDFTHGGLESVGEMDVPAAIELALPWHTLSWMEIYQRQINQVTPLFNAVELHKQAVASSCLQAVTNIDPEISLFWSRPAYHENLSGIRLIRKQGNFPNSPDDPTAEIIFEGNNIASIQDETIEIGVEYFYSLYEIPSNYLIAQTQAQAGIFSETDSVTCIDDGDLDDDGLQDALEIILNTNFSNPDTDNDGANDFIEINLDNDPTNISIGIDTDPSDADTDNDGLLDGFEINNGFNPLTPDDANLDTDADGLSNLEEQNLETDPNVNDTDNDGLLDGDEVNIHFTDPQLVDTDGDMLDDNEEVNRILTNPILIDTDGDGFNDGDEVINGSDPLDANSPSTTLPNPINVPLPLWSLICLSMLLLGVATKKNKLT